MSKHCGIKETLALVAQVKDAAQEFVAREQRLTAEMRARIAAENKAFETAATAQATQAAQDLKQAQADFEVNRERRQRQFELRKKRINQAHITSRSRAMDAIREHEGKRKYKVQEGTLGSERQRDADLAAAAARLQEFTAKLADADAGLQSAEQQARAALRGYSSLCRRLQTEAGPGIDPAADEEQLLARSLQTQERVRKDVDGLSRLLLAKAGRHLPIWIGVLLLLAGSGLLVPVVRNFLGSQFPSPAVGGGLIALGAILMVARFAGARQALPAANRIAEGLANARRLHQAAEERSRQRYEQDQQRIQAEFEDARRRLGLDWKRAVKESIDLLDIRPKKLDEQASRVAATNERLHRARLGRLEREHPQVLATLQEQGALEARRLDESHSARVLKLETEEQSRINALAAEWNQRITPLVEKIRSAQATAQATFPEWRTELWEQWTPPVHFENAAKLGELQVDFDQLVGTPSAGRRLAFPGSGQFSLPLQLTYPNEGSVLFEAGASGAEEALPAINNIIFRLLSVTPPGKLSFTIFDPVGLGQNFAGLMHLADYEDSHINSRIWTQTNQLEEKLAELNEHMEKVIQMYLRNEYATIAEYNAQAGTIAEKYHFLVIADFPVNFSETAARRLINIATSGARCGVYTLIHWDRRQPLPAGFVADDLKKSSIGILRAENQFSFAGQLPGTRLQLDPPPLPEFATEFLRKVGESSKDANRVEVPFSQVAPAAAELWTEDTTEELQVPIGRSGATKLQYLEIGRGTRQHALIAGKTGSGKSTLFHVMITNLALWCSPEAVEFYLVDFKKGVEFKCYATHRLPHARVVAIESDRQFGLSVLQRVDEELRRRGDLFRKLGVQDLAGYKRAGGTEPMPRSLLMIDEFQEFFTEEDRVSQGAAVLLDRIVRQGRAFGVHVILGSQTLGGAYTLARATMGQMVIRIALQCNEADAYLIMDQDNPAPRLLSRPGEGIYNDAAGALEGNSPFQAVWLPEEVRDTYLDIARQRANRETRKYPGPFVFEGNAPSDVRDNEPLRALLRTSPASPPSQARIWLGAPNSVKGPTEAVFQRQSGSGLLIVGQAEEPALSILSLALIALSAQYPKGSVRFLLLDSTAPGVPHREYLERVVRGLPHEVIQVKHAELAERMGELSEELKQRGGGQGGHGPETFLFIHGLQNYKKLKQEDEFSFSEAEAASPAAVLLKLISEGPALGFHVIATCDTYTNLARYLGRKTLNEFDMRILFQMSASDSASLIDDPGASTLGLNRALFYNNREGYIETFRPYSLPESSWLEENLTGPDLKRFSGK